MDIVIKEKDETISWEEIHAVIKEAFKDYPTEYGINSDYITQDTEWLKERLTKGITFVAINKENNQLVGTSTLLLANGRFKYGFNRTSAVIPLVGHSGLGNKLLKEEIKICRQHDCEFLFSDTYHNATVANKWHRRNGFMKLKLRATGIVPHYTVRYIMPLKHKWLFNRVTIGTFYALQSTWTRLTKNPDGTRKGLFK
ncbi:MAG: GNAT family N-acetyltransferase [Bacteroidales bacterium]|nr:GNAT family N-acetyltransferase [Candidatus Sodaliphilus aphodohippi]